MGEVPQALQEDVGPWDRRQTAVDAFTLMHHDLDVCTNSLQVILFQEYVTPSLLPQQTHFYLNLGVSACLGHTVYS